MLRVAWSLVFWFVFFLGMLALSQYLNGRPVDIDRLDVIGSVLLSLAFTAVGVLARWIYARARRLVRA